MRIAVVVVTPDAAIERAVSVRRSSLIPGSYRNQGYKAAGGAEITVSCLRAESRAAAKELVCGWLMQQVSDSAVLGLILVADIRMREWLNHFDDTFFATYYTNPGISNPHNFFSAFFSKILRAYQSLAVRFDDLKYRKLLTLPTRNFRAAEFRHLCEVCGNTSDLNAFGERLDLALAAMRNRQRPKHFGDRPEVYLVDDDEKHFRLGHERHARAETAVPPHEITCITRNSFRFGRRFDSDRHWNVSLGVASGKMEDNYPDCHGVLRPGGGSTHLNMFSNDFF